MPMSRDETIMPVLRLVKTLRPKAILDIGCGDGFYGVLFRRALDGDVTNGGGFHKRSFWQVKIDAIEIFSHYITPVHNYVYDLILKGNVNDQIKNLHTRYDVVFMGDVIEHMKLATGLMLIDNLRAHIIDGGHLIIITPDYRTQFNSAPSDNPHEQHHALYTQTILNGVSGYKTKSVSKIGKKLMAVYER